MFSIKDLISLSILTILFYLIYGGALAIPPRSDYWHLFYLFSHITRGLKPITNTLTFLGSFGHPRFQPLAFLGLYIEYVLFGFNFILYNFSNLLLALGVFIQLYFIIKLIMPSFLISCLLTLLGAFLLSHSDIIIWSYHIYIIFGVFCIFGAVHAGYFYYLKRKSVFLIVAGLLLMIAVWCYEPFISAPFILFLLAGNLLRDRKLALRATLLFYGPYMLAYILYQLLPKYLPLDFSIWQFMTLGHIISSIKIASANMFYINFLTTLFPFLGVPVSYFDNTVLILAHQHKDLISFLQDYGLVIFGIGLILMYLYKKKDTSRSFPVLLAAAAMLFTYLVLLAFGRSITNPPLYIYLQFRYQFFPNLLMIIILAVLIRSYIHRRRKGIITASIFLSIILIFNMALTFKTVQYVRGLFDEDRKFIEVVTKAVKDGAISPDKKLYIDEAKINSMACWNRETANFPGNIQWFFKGKEDCFARTKEEAGLIIY